MIVVIMSCHRFSTLASGLVLFAGVFSCHSLETVIFPTGTNGTIHVATNEAIRVDSYYQERNPDPGGGSSYVKVLADGRTYSVSTLVGPANPAVIAGPVDLLFPSNVNQVVTFQKIPGGAVHTLYFTAGQTNTINVPTNKTIVFFNQLPEGIPAISGSQAFIGCKVKKNGLTSEFEPRTGLWQGIEFMGPATLTLYPSLQFSAHTNSLISYYFAEDYASVPAFGAVQAPTGRSALTIEKSTDLDNWFPAFIHQGATAEKAYYRFQIGR